MMPFDYTQIAMRLEMLGPEEKLVYFTGWLDAERLERPRGEACKIANRARELSRWGRVHLLQRRLGPPVTRSITDWRHGHGPGFEYIAIGCGRKADEHQRTG